MAKIIKFGPRGDRPEVKGACPSPTPQTKEGITAAIKFQGCPTFTATIYVAGDVSTIRNACREYCMVTGLCVTAPPTDFVYTGGMESGCAIGLVNYPRFPSTVEKIVSIAEELAVHLMCAAHQWSALVVTPQFTQWINRRPDPSGAKPE